MKHESLTVDRVSARKQSIDDHFSLVAQEQAIRAVPVFSYIRSRGSNRKELDAILAPVTHEHLDAVVVPELGRLARDGIATLLFLKELKAAGARFVSAADNQRVFW